MSRYILSPEFHRNLWASFSPFRLAAVPLLAGLGSLTVMNMAEKGFDALVIGSLTAYWLVVIVWGSYAAGAAVQDEIRNNTWDFQRLSSLAPWQYAIGKFFGATAYSWYFGLVLWAVFAAAWFSQGQAGTGAADILLRKAAERGVLPPETLQAETLRLFLYSTFFMVIAGIFAHALAFYEGCRNLTAGGERTRGIARWRANMGGFLLGVIVGSVIFFTFAPGGTQRALGFGGIYRVYAEAGDVNWHGFMVDGLAMTVLSLLFFTGWVLAGIWRLLKEGLMCRLWPVAWPLFTATLVIYCTGFMENPGHQLRFACAIAFLLTYIVMFRDAGNPAKYRRLAASIEKGDARRIAENTPLWAASATVLALLYAGLAAKTAQEPETMRKALVFMSAAVLFLLRDGFVIHAVYWRNARDKFIVVTYYILAYVIVPKLHSDIQLREFDDFVRGAGGDKAASWISAAYFPAAYDDWWVSVTPPLVQAVLAGLFLRWMITRKP